jgi:hypothetical protein
VKVYDLPDELLFQKKIKVPRMTLDREAGASVAANGIVALRSGYILVLDFSDVTFLSFSAAHEMLGLLKAECDDLGIKGRVRGMNMPQSAAWIVKDILWMIGAGNVEA